MSEQPYLIFDAGGVLIFPDFARLAEIARKAGIEASAQTVLEAHCRYYRDFDEQVAQTHQHPKIHYFADLFGYVTEDAEKARLAAHLTLEEDQRKHIWTDSHPWVGEALQALKAQGYQMAVISNSDGRVEEILADVGLRAYFETVTDSFVVGVEKPDPRIFEIALKRLGWRADEVIYIGDVFYIDVWGANQAGLGAVHIDQLGLYSGWAGAHIPGVRELPGWLAQFDGQVPSEILFPARDFEIN